MKIVNPLSPPPLSKGVRGDLKAISLAILANYYSVVPFFCPILLLKKFKKIVKFIKFNQLKNRRKLALILL